MRTIGKGLRSASALLLLVLGASVVFAATANAQANPLSCSVQQDGDSLTIQLNVTNFVAGSVTAMDLVRGEGADEQFVFLGRERLTAPSSSFVRVLDDNLSGEFTVRARVILPGDERLDRVECGTADADFDQPTQNVLTCDTRGHGPSGEDVGGRVTVENMTPGSVVALDLVRGEGVNEQFVFLGRHGLPDPLPLFFGDTDTFSSQAFPLTSKRTSKASSPFGPDSSFPTAHASTAWNAESSVSTKSSKQYRPECWGTCRFSPTKQRAMCGTTPTTSKG